MRLVVVGGVAAGLSAASRARRLDRYLEIIVLEKGRRISYGACGLPYFIEGQVRSIDDLVTYGPEVFERDRDIRIRTGAEVARIRHANREVVLTSGEKIPYDQLVWAAGARPGRWPHPRAFSFHTDEDAARLKDFLARESPKTAAVVGGGYIGLEMATALRAQGLQVTLFDSGNSLLHWDSADFNKTLMDRLERCGVRLRMGQTVRSVEDTGCDFAVVATGLTPNVEVPLEAGVEAGTSGAIRTDAQTRTNIMGLFAAGDCAETLHRVSGRAVWVPLGTTANKMGRVAGANAAGRRERFEGIVGTSIVRVGGLGVGTTGLSEPAARQCGFSPVRVRIEDRDKARYFRGGMVAVELIADRRTGRLLGGSVTGDDGVAGRINTIATALTAQMDVRTFSELDLAYSPPFATVMDPLLVAGQQLLKLLD